MEHFSTTIDGRKISISNLVMIKDEITDEKENTVMISEPEPGEDALTGEVLFEAVFCDPDDADAFYELMRKARLTHVG